MNVVCAFAETVAESVCCPHAESTFASGQIGRVSGQHFQTHDQGDDEQTADGHLHCLWVLLKKRREHGEMRDQFNDLIKYRTVTLLLDMENTLSVLSPHDCRTFKVSVMTYFPPHPILLYSGPRKANSGRDNYIGSLNSQTDRPTSFRYSRGGLHGLLLWG